MPASKVDLSGVTLDDASLKYLDSKNLGTRTAYEKCLKRFHYFYEGGLREFIGEIEREEDLNRGRPTVDRVRPGEGTIRRFIKWHGEAGYSNNATRQSTACLQNALKFYGITMSYDFISLPPAIPLKENEKHAWTLDQVREFVAVAEYLRDKAFIMVGFQSGLSIGDIVELNYGDIKRDLEGGVLPVLIHRYRQKTKVEHKTFLGADAVRYLKQYLSARPGLRDRDPLFTMLGSKRRVSKGAIQVQLRKYAKKVGFILDEDLENGYNPARPHSLRSGFRSRLTGKMDGQLIEFFMGHDIGEEKKTYINMPEDELRELYASYEHLLAIEKTSRDELTEQPQELVSLKDEVEHLRQELEEERMRGRDDNKNLRDLVRTLAERLEVMERKLVEKQP